MGRGGLNLALWFGSKLPGAPQVVERERNSLCNKKRKWFTQTKIR